MATHRSAEKRHRQSLKRRTRNRYALGTIRSAVKDTQAAVKAGNKSEAEKALRAVTRLLEKAVVHHTLHRNNASRQISRLQTQVNRLA